VSRVLHEAGYQLEEVPTRPHPDKVRRFERATPNQLWQTDLFTFMLKRQNRRVYRVAFMDDQSRFLTGYGLYASQASALVLLAKMQCRRQPGFRLLIRPTSPWHLGRGAEPYGLPAPTLG
jgi:transposase InsO family protein